MTETSLFPDELRHAGIAFSEACAQLIDIADKGTIVRTPKLLAKLPDERHGHRVLVDMERGDA